MPSKSVKFRNLDPFLGIKYNWIKNALKRLIEISPFWAPKQGIP